MRYLIEMLMCGEDGGTIIELEAQNNNDMWKKLYAINRYGGIEDYEEEEGEPYTNLNANECRAYMLSDEDVVCYVYNVTQQREVYTHEMWYWSRHI